MGIPQVPSQVKRGPGEALRAIFAGIGKLLMAADRPEQVASPAQPGESDGRERRDPVSATRAERRPRQASRRPGRAAPSAPPSRWRSLDQTGNVRLLTPEEVADNLARMRAAEAPAAEAVAAEVVAVPDAAVTDAADRPDGYPETGPPGWPAAAVAYDADLGDAAAVRPIGWQAPADAAATPPAAALTSAALPLPGYDDLSLASIRARLRGLDVPQLRLLIDYESANAERSELLGMYARRIEKLESDR